MTTRFIVVGVGSMGANHVRVLSLLKGVELIGVVDTDETRAREIGDLFGVPCSTEVSTFIDDTDAACICVPSSLHRDVAMAFLERGIHCLIEKPLATTREACMELINTAESSGARLAVGHIEEHNPVVGELKSLLESSGRIFAIDARRMSYASSRITDVDVILDLMVHDVGVILSLANSEVVETYARGVKSQSSAGFDYITALLTFASGGVASLTASRITQTQVRQLHVTSEAGFIAADYISQDLEIFRHGLFTQGPYAQGAYVLDMAIERVFVPPAEPLERELSDFVASIETGRAPLVSGKDAIKTLEVVWELRDIVMGAER